MQGTIFDEIFKSCSKVPSNKELRIFGKKLYKTGIWKFQKKMRNLHSQKNPYRFVPP